MCNYSVVIEWEDAVDVVPVMPMSLGQAIDLREKYVKQFKRENKTGARRVYVIFGERMDV
jgi:hypothetical protein